MSALNRTCLRLAAVAALRGQTLAGSNILDSGMGAIDAMQPEERVPMISVYTEEDGGAALSEQNGGAVKQVVELVFDVSMVEALFDGDTIIIGQPTTDAELEVTLDLVEAQIHRTLFEDVTLPLSVAFRKAMLRDPLRRESLRFRDEKSAERMAHRYVIYRIQVQDEPLLIAYDPTLTGLDRLPPTFAAVASLWPDGLYEKTVAMALADRLAQPQTQPFQGLSMTAPVMGMADVSDQVSTAALLTEGDGTISVAAEPLLMGAQKGTYRIIFSTATTFIVSDPDGTDIGFGRVGVPFATQIGFTITSGDQAFAANDEFDFTVLIMPGAVTLNLDFTP